MSNTAFAPTETMQVRPRNTRTASAVQSYMTSSQDLRSGLEVRMLEASQLPAELLRELLRLRACWQLESGRSAHRGVGRLAGLGAR